MEFDFLLETRYSSPIINVTDKSVDVIMGLRFEHSLSEYCFAIVSYYLPPVGATSECDSQTFFSHLLAQMYTVSVEI